MESESPTYQTALFPGKEFVDNLMRMQIISLMVLEFGYYSSAASVL